MTLPVHFSDVTAAAERIGEWVVPTPVVYAPALGERCSGQVYLKLETRQRTGSFKDRGAANRLLQLTAEERVRGVVAMSAGNHAQAVAYVCGRLEIPATIVMPEGTPFTKIRRTQAFGARVVIAGDSLAASTDHAQRIVETERRVLVHPYDDPRVIAGQGTAALELLRDVAELDTLLVPIGGGGLISGIAIAVRELAPKMRIVGVQTEAFPGMERAVRGLDSPAAAQTIAEGIAVKTAGVLTRPIVERLVDEIVLVTDEAIERAIHCLLEEEKLLAEGAGAAGLAALLSAPDRFRAQRVGLIITGGNIDSGLLANVIMRVRLREGLVVRLRIEISDRPGVLADVARLIGECGANILDVTHQRLFFDVSSKNADLDITLETRSPTDVEDILAKLDAAHYPATLLTSMAH